MMNERKPGIIRDIAPFNVRGLAIPYAEFVPKLYNLCKSLGFESGYIMPSRAFCSDENQGFPIILISKHFGTFPFDHGRVGGIIATDRHGPHAGHGEDSVIVQASHVGYDPATSVFGYCRRPKMHGDCISSSCGKISHVIQPYLDQYIFARQRIFLHRTDTGDHLITVKDSFIDFDTKPVTDGLVLRLHKVVKTTADNRIVPVATHCTSHTYEVSEDFRKRIDSTGYTWKGGVGEAINGHLCADLFFFRENLHETDDSVLLERNLIEFMPVIVTHKSPALKAAKINIQMEFARTVESIRRGTDYEGKNLLYVAGLNIDISAYQNYPETTYFVPWAAHVQLKDACPTEYIHPLEQEQLYTKLMQQSTINADQISLKDEIDRMLRAPRYDIYTPR
ncbi:hypothetical protein [Desulfopila inferna]|mgnify:CR=1 FL=1|uniref:hypothetical protein n=1 Tax=Desulfopila inferna TaxID=468528 RepID=UPI001965E6EA|nr:hypothetical protein [Desulfopila inferna]MBM9605141.1 hypothetical protein [Desulfopila inferna]